MSELDTLLQSVRPEEPSSSYFDKGLARIEAFGMPPHLVSPVWRYATIGLALLFGVSLTLNITNWMQEERNPPEEIRLVSSELRPDGELMIRETRYEVSRAEEGADE